ncbi:hypothetical protein [Burkholderia ambifaria]|uniref:hypothetical protein n=1 Tax=Burkholderia ambifaria TaxID=152480 RepID=UPI001590870C|nr:hypothetical protein [Burkholderia ambifaria]
MTDLGNAAGKAGVVTDVNSSGVVVGIAQVAGVDQAFEATNGTETPLQSLATGHASRVLAISDNGVIAGTADDAGDQTHPVVWTASTPSAVPTVLSLPLGGVSGEVTSINPQGMVTGVSRDANDTKTPVLWTSPSAGPTVLPASGLLGVLGQSNINCVPTQVAPSSSGAAPLVAGTCPNNGHNVPVLWSSTGLLSTYVMTPLSLPPNATSCETTDVNASGQVGGTCIVGGTSMAVRWSRNGSPDLLSGVQGNAATTEIRMNALGHAVVSYLNQNGNAAVALWNPDNHTVQPIGSFADGGTWAAGLSDNDVIAITGETSLGVLAEGVWNNGNLTNLGNLGGPNSSAAAISPNGRYVAGESERPGETSDPVVDDLSVATAVRPALVRKTSSH